MRTLIGNWITRQITGPLDAMYARLDENLDDGSYACDPTARPVATPPDVRQRQPTFRN